MILVSTSSEVKHVIIQPLKCSTIFTSYGFFLLSTECAEGVQGFLTAACCSRNWCYESEHNSEVCWTMSWRLGSSEESCRLRGPFSARSESTPGREPRYVHINSSSISHRLSPQQTKHVLCLSDIPVVLLTENKNNPMWPSADSLHNKLVDDRRCSVTISIISAASKEIVCYYLSFIHMFSFQQAIPPHSRVCPCVCVCVCVYGSPTDHNNNIHVRIMIITACLDVRTSCTQTLECLLFFFFYLSCWRHRAHPP